jgi:hypothetical protein
MKAEHIRAPLCAYCGRPCGRKSERATFVGAPKGGVPVHRDCLTAFFQAEHLMDSIAAETESRS